MVLFQQFSTLQMDYGHSASVEITVSPRSQRISTYVTLAIFLGLSYVGVSALLAFIDAQLANQ